jgi:hypothetical protein
MAMTGGGDHRGGLGSGERDARAGQQAGARAQVWGREGVRGVGQRRKGSGTELALGGVEGGRHKHGAREGGHAAFK